MRAIVFGLVFALAGCAPAAAKQEGVAKNEVDTSCKVDADCAVKDVGSCCGAYPACVNAASPTFPAQVKAECAKGGMSSVCGFPVVEGCECVEGRCAATDAPAGDVR